MKKKMWTAMIGSVANSIDEIAANPAAAQAITWTLGFAVLLFAPDVFAQAAGGGVASYGDTMFGKLDLSPTIVKAAGLGGTVGAGISGWKLYQGMSDGGRLSENVGPAVGVGVSAILLGFSSFKTALIATGTQ